MTGRRLGRRLDVAAVAAAAAVTVVTRWSTVVARAPLSYDDGVYLTSVSLLRTGAAPFRDVFSSQGPAFLPLLWLGDLAGGRQPWSARLVPLAAGVVLAAVVHRLALLAGDRWSALVATLLVATSGAVLFTTSQVEADAIAAAFAAGAVLLAAGTRPSSARWQLAAVAVTLGAAVAVKTVLVAPAALAVAWLVWRRHRSAVAVAGVAAGSAAVVVALALPWGPAAVWEQAVAFHLHGRAYAQSIEARWALVRRSLWRRDRVLLGAAALALVTAAARRARHRPPPAAPPVAEDLAAAAWLWLGGTAAVLAVHQPVFDQHLTALIAPAAVLVARYRPPVVAVAVAGALLLPSQGSASGWRLSSPRPTPSEARMVDLLASIEPGDGLVISDEPSLSWLAGRIPPGHLVDTSFVRFESGSVEVDDVAAAVERPDVCAVLFWSGRFDELGLTRKPAGYRPAVVDGDHELLVRDTCRLGVPPPGRVR